MVHGGPPLIEYVPEGQRFDLEKLLPAPNWSVSRLFHRLIRAHVVFVASKVSILLLEPTRSEPE